MTVLRTLRSLVLGETWVLPIGVGVVVGAALVIKEAAPDFFADAGGFLVLGGVLVLLVVAVSRGS